MTHARQERTYSVDSTQRKKPSYEHRVADRNTTKKFLTNTDKSIFNLTWEVGGVAEKNYQRSRDHIEEDKSPARYQPYYKQQQGQSKPKKEPIPMTSIGTINHAPSEPIAYYYPYAYPPTPINQQAIDSQKSRRITKSRVKQNEKPVDSKDKFKIEHHYVGSPNETQRLINKLRRKGFVETGVRTPAVHPNRNKK